MGEREPLVLIHGFSGVPVTFEPVMPLLAEHHELHALTLAGHCGGPALAEGVECTPAALADDLERQLDALGLDAPHLCGNSLGGWMAIELAARGRAGSVVALAPAGGWEAGSREERRLGRFFRRQYRMIRYAAPRAERVLRRPRMRRLAMRDVCVHGDRWTVEQAAAMTRGAIECAIYEPFLEVMERDGPPTAFDGVSCPVRIVWGTRDRVVPVARHLPRWREMLPDAEVVVLDGLGHVPMVDDPQAVARTVLEVTQAAPAASYS
jgi:pimeloyl-ACP methyl ester carboxylesterase